MDYLICICIEGHVGFNLLCEFVLHLLDVFLVLYREAGLQNLDKSGKYLPLLLQITVFYCFFFLWYHKTV